MKSGVVHAPFDIRYEDIDIPEIAENEVLVKVKYTGICGSDIPRVLGDACHYYPNVLGHEFSGTVVRTGEKTKHIQVGDKVAGVPLQPCMKCSDCKAGNFSLCKNYKFTGSSRFGSFAEYVAMPETNVVKLADNVSFEQGALFEPVTIAVHGILKAGFKENTRVAIVGGGTIGIFVMQWAKIFHAKQIAIFDILDERLALAEEMGADAVLNSGDTDLSEKINACTDGQGFDYVFETSGVDQTIHMAMEIANNCATVCYIGTPKHKLTFSVRQWEIINRKELTIVGSWMSYSLPFPGREWTLAAEHFSKGDLKIHKSMIDRIMPLSKIDEAFKLFASPGKVKGKVLIDSEA